MIVRAKCNKSKSRSKFKPPGIPPSQRKGRGHSSIPCLVKLWRKHPREREEFVLALPEPLPFLLYADGLYPDDVIVLYMLAFARHMGHSVVRNDGEILDLSDESWEPSTWGLRSLINSVLRLRDKLGIDLEQPGGPEQFVRAINSRLKSIGCEEAIALPPELVSAVRKGDQS